MTEQKILDILEEISEETGFSFTIGDYDEDNEVELYMQGDNPCGEDWCETITIKNPKNKKELIENLAKEVWERYYGFDIEENVCLMLEAKKNGFQGVPDVVNLVHNEERI